MKLSLSPSIPIDSKPGPIRSDRNHSEMNRVDWPSVYYTAYSQVVLVMEYLKIRDTPKSINNYDES